jgi:hypothetical protein
MLTHILELEFDHNATQTTPKKHPPILIIVLDYKKISVQATSCKD